MRVSTALLSLTTAGLAPAQYTNQSVPDFTALDYGGSPPVYPSPEGAGVGDWASAYNKARALVSQMTNEEKENLTIGYTSTTNGCSGNSGSAKRVGFPGLCLNDAGNGVRGTEGVSGFAAGVHVGAAWNRNLAYNRAQYMGAEFRAKGGTLLGPSMLKIAS